MFSYSELYFVVASGYTDLRYGIKTGPDYHRKIIVQESIKNKKSIISTLIHIFTYIFSKLKKQYSSL